MTIPSFLRVESDGVILQIKVQPRASKNEVGEPLGGELRVKVSAPPVDSAANEALIRLLAEEFDCPMSKVLMLRGQTSRHKSIKLFGVSADTVLTRLQGS
jgi:uncharacterized protein (TIGR00251 family)